ncbi:MAG: Non-motile and phage-resistance protein [Syntrophorhabdaceae bacterium PtaU1.Bin034]|jgi:hypothetical protein|nr:MAG: Non-motile and phage-resistance protein [Syntrophorhabdaceae bacterium PtaU1.Bin034]
MLEELSDHIMDIAMNSVRAGARNISISVVADKPNDLLTITISDDGVGMDEEMVKSVTDPFFSTKNGKKVGLGVSLLKGAAEMCEGTFELKSTAGRGTEIKATFVLDHPDVPPIGNLRDTFFLLCVSNPDIRFIFRYERPDAEEFILDTRDIKETLNGVPINHPEVIDFLGRYLEKHL